jgi:hypothetical protein
VTPASPMPTGHIVMRESLGGSLISTTKSGNAVTGGSTSPCSLDLITSLGARSVLEQLLRGWVPDVKRAPLRRRQPSGEFDAH